MSRDQKPGKFKLVGVAATNPGRRRDDRQSEQVLVATALESAADPAGDAQADKRHGLFQIMLFVLCSAIGAAGTVYLGLVGGLPA